MFPSASSTSPLHNSPDSRNPHDRNSRPPLPHSHSQSNMGFNAGSTSSSGGAFGSWGGGSTGAGMNDPFAPSRSHYQPGFLMSVTQSNAAPPGGQHFEDPPLIPTKFNPSNSRASPSEFGLESIFEHPKRQRQPPSDEDAPPTASVNDIMEEPHGSRFQGRNSHSGSPLSHSASRRPAFTPQQPQVALHQPVTYLNVFGYPSDRYESIARLFQSLGNTTDPEPNENGTWFTIGFRQSWEAERALRRNGKVMDDAYMIGVARAHSPAADTPLDTFRPGGPAVASGSPPSADPFAPGKESLVPAFGLPRSATTSSLGMPLMLAPSTSAFRTSSAPMKAAEPKESGFGPHLGQQQPPQPGKMSESSTMSKISDMIFGW